MTNVMKNLHPFYRDILITMYKYGLNDGSYDPIKGKVWLSRLSYLLNMNKNDVDTALDTLMSYELITNTEDIIEKIDDNGVDKYVRCYVLNPKSLDGVKSWCDMFDNKDIADTEWWNKD